MDVNSISANVMYTNLTSSWKSTPSRQAIVPESEDLQQADKNNETVKDDDISNEKFRVISDNYNVIGEKIRCSSELFIGSNVDVYID